MVKHPLSKGEEAKLGMIALSCGPPTLLSGQVSLDSFPVLKLWGAIFPS